MKIISLEAEKYYKTAYDLFFYEENSKSARKYVNLALNLNPNHKRALRLLGNILILEDKINQATKVWQRLNEITKGDFEVNSKLAFCYEKKAQYDLALEFCAKSAKEVSLGDFEKMGTLYALKIELLLQIGKKACAQNILKNAIRNLSQEEAQNLRSRFDYLPIGANSGVIEFKKSQKAL